MGHHIDEEGRFQSDRHPDLAPDKIVLSFKDPLARQCLGAYASMTTDKELGEDIAERIRTIEEGMPAAVKNFDQSIKKTE